MRKILTLLGTITLIGISTTSLVACKDKINNGDNNNNEKKPSPIVTQPPENSEWLLVNKSEYKIEFNKKISKWYAIIYFSRYMDENIFAIDKEKISFAGVTEDNCIAVNGGLYVNPLVYRWNGNGEPQTPTIDENTSEITDWKE